MVTLSRDQMSRVSKHVQAVGLIILVVFLLFVHVKC